MEKQNRTHVQVLLPEIMAMMAEEETRRAKGQAVKRLLERERRKGRKLETEILPRPKGRPGEAAAPRDRWKYPRAKTISA